MLHILCVVILNKCIIEHVEIASHHIDPILEATRISTSAFIYIFRLQMCSVHLYLTIYAFQNLIKLLKIFMIQAQNSRAKLHKLNRE